MSGRGSLRVIEELHRIAIIYTDGAEDKFSGRQVKGFSGEQTAGERFLLRCAIDHIGQDQQPVTDHALNLVEAAGQVERGEGRGCLEVQQHERNAVRCGCVEQGIQAVPLTVGTGMRAVPASKCLSGGGGVEDVRKCHQEIGAPLGMSVR